MYKGLEGASVGGDTCPTQAVVGAEIPGLSLPFTLKFRGIKDLKAIMLLRREKGLQFAPAFFTGGAGS